MFEMSNMDEFTSEELTQIEKNYTINTCKEYLKNTDRYYARKMETGEEVPEDIVAKRIEAREFIRANDAADME